MGYAWKWLFRKCDRSNCLFGKIAIIAFVVAQCLDGIFTYVGVKTWGPNAEANFIIGRLMSIVGVGLALVTVKLVGVGCGIFLRWRGFHNSVVTFTVIYLVVAVFPWVLVLFF